MCVRFPVVQLMAELCLSTGLGKRKRVMDEKELMIPLELGYVQEAERRKALMDRFTSKCSHLLLITNVWHAVFLNNSGLFLIL